MNQTNANLENIRVANFTRLDLPVDHGLDFNSEDVDTMVERIRRHADLPYVYVVGRKQAGHIPELLAALKAIRSPCYPYALFTIDGADLDIGDTDLDLVGVDGANPEIIHNRIGEYAATRLNCDKSKLRLGTATPVPSHTEVVIVGAGITGLYAANKLKKAGIAFCILEKEDIVGGIWSGFANSTSQVNTSECAYRLFEKATRSNSDHSYTWEILADIAQLSDQVADHLYLKTEVHQIQKTESGYRTRLIRNGESMLLESIGIILAINDRVGAPKEISYENQSAFQGTMVTGISDDAKDLDWRNKDVFIVGMGAFAVENARTALEGGARHVTVVCRRHGTICPKIIDYLNFSTPYDDEFKHPNRSNILNMMYWKKLYELSGATQPECWMGKIKHEGHTISVSDIWFIGHYLKKIETRQGEITAMTSDGVILDGRHHIAADIVMNCIGFKRNASVAKSISGYHDTYNNNFVDKNFMYLADAYIDDDAFNSLFGSSVLEMVKFYMQLFITYFNNPDYDSMMRTEGIEKIPMEDRKWSDYINGAMALIRRYPGIREMAQTHVAQRTENFHEFHDLETYIAENKRAWIHTHSMLAGRPMTAEECLPYVFEKLLISKR